MKGRTPLVTLVLVLTLAIGFMAVQATLGAKPTLAQNEENHYIGAQKCANCHDVEESGDCYKKWMNAAHAKAYKSLGSEESHALAKAAGVGDPQKADACLKCHVTAFGVSPDLVAPDFDPTLGVQCESCHGPGERHFKARVAAALADDGGDDGGFGGFGDDDEEEYEYEPLPEGEIISNVPTATCLGCHNAESPSFKPFCFKKRLAEIAHLDPRRPRTAKLLEALKCTCDGCGSGGECCCTAAECGTLEDILNEIGRND